MFNLIRSEWLAGASWETLMRRYDKTSPELKDILSGLVHPVKGTPVRVDKPKGAWHTATQVWMAQQKARK